MKTLIPSFWTNVICEACGCRRASIKIGNTMICKICEPDIRAGIDGRAIDVLSIARQYFREHHNAGTYTLHDMPWNLKVAAEEQAVDENLTLRVFILKALEEYLRFKTL